MGAKRGERIGALDDPAEGEEGDSSKNSSAPSERVPSAVLPDGEPPLLPESGWVRVSRVGRVRIVDLLAIEAGVGVGVGLGMAFVNFIGNFSGRRWSGSRIWVLMITHFSV